MRVGKVRLYSLRNHDKLSKRTAFDGGLKLTKLIAWAVTGAGHFLAGSFSLMEKLVKEYDVKVTTFLSNAAVETIRIYGFNDRLTKISDGTYYSEVLREDDEGPASPTAARLSKGIYSVLIVSPASANTVAKVAMGIADNLVTNTVAHAGKGKVPVLIVPTDQEAETETVLPAMVDRDVCRACEVCQPIEKCPHDAISRVAGKARIDLSKCEGTGVCEEVCPYGAIKVNESVKVKSRKVDLDNVDKLKEMEGIRVLKDPTKIISELLLEIGVDARK
jgi:dihydromethanopterin reductase (acceptor)